MPVHHKQTKSDRQAFRTRPVLPEVQRWLGLANLIPPSEEFPDQADGMALVDSLIDRGTLSSETLEEAILKVFRDLAKKHPGFRKHVGKIDMSRLSEVNQKCNELSYARNFLRAIADAAAKHQPNTRTRIFKYEDLLAPERPFIDEEGKIDWETTEVAKAVRGVEARRIRRCDVCDRLFWAGRLDKWACSPEHQRARRKQQYNERYLKKIKMQRIATSASKVINPT